MTFTKSWLQKQITDLEATRDEIPFGLDEDGNNTLAALKLALAGMEAEPVASPFGYLRVVSGRSFQIMEGPTRPPDRSGDCAGPWFPIWTSAPAPQTLTNSERAELESYRNAHAVPGEAVSDDCPAFIKYDVTEVDEAWARGFNACRTAMLQGGKS